MQEFSEQHFNLNPEHLLYNGRSGKKHALGTEHELNCKAPRRSTIRYKRTNPFKPTHDCGF